MKETGLYSRFFDESNVAMAVLNCEGEILCANGKFDSLLESLSLPSRQMENITNRNSGPRSINEILNPLQTSLFWSSLMPLVSGRQSQVDFENLFHSGHAGGIIPHWVKIHAWRMDTSAEAKEEILIGLCLEDFTITKQEEKKLLEDKEIAEKSMEAKSQFLANMSHEIRTPIQTIMGMTELLSDTHLDHEQTEYSRQVKFSAEVLLSLINDILDYSKIDAGKMELEHIDFNLEQAIEQAVEMIALEAHKKGLSIATKIPPEADIFMTGDQSKFRQIVINLVKNAVKFTAEGSIVISAALSELNGKEAIRVSVADTGIGISEEKRPLLFSTFMQADVSNTRRFGGTGLGLAISRNLVDLMKGNIEMVPNEGGGSVFRFDIPLERSKLSPPPMPPPENEGKLKILIVDDRSEARDITSSYLKDLGYTEIAEAESGEAALEMMRAASAAGKAYQLIFIDMTMPVMDGWRLAAEIHNDTNIKQADLILMVPHGLMGADTKMTLLKWFRAYINKPIKRRSLAETISQILNEPRELEELKDQAEGLSLFEEETGKTPSPVYGEEILSAPPPPIKEKPLILIAEDYQINQQLFSIMMDKLGYPSLLADDGRDAMEKALSNNVALVFMDIQMPVMNGYEATEKLRKEGFTKPIIAVTASALSDEWERCYKAGFDDILIKPFKRSGIEAMLLKWINTETLKEIIPEQIHDIKAFDAEALLETFMGNIEMVLPLLRRFIERTASQLNSIQEYEKTHDWESARREAHTIRGASLMMGGTELGEAAIRLEQAYKNIDFNEMKSAYPAVASAFIRFKNEAEDYIQLMGDPS